MAEVSTQLKFLFILMVFKRFESISVLSNTVTVSSLSFLWYNSPLERKLERGFWVRKSSSSLCTIMFWHQQVYCKQVWPQNIH